MPAVYVFDAYGTLFDTNAAVQRHQAAMGPDGPAFSALWRRKQLEYSWIRGLAGRHDRDFWQLTEDALDFSFQFYPKIDPALREALLDAYRDLDAYTDAVPALRALKEAGAKLVILSNGSAAMLERAASSSGIAEFFDAIISVDEAKTYKPSPAVYELVTTLFRVYPEAVSFQSSNRWDVAGAKSFGFRTVWINRFNEPDEYWDLSPDLVLPDLISLRAD
ncbi:2-haloacid dehalogenase [Fulvimarina manganoxydans]|uniref:(S)-2-haloacid dehalogenase n=2 Tax=Fulvimarina manganoxydans TaxID=937218 RepID=A0A1W2EEP6_9HYPH|nr:2-haloacid dehalogenase [Fulvimarina manganoxydans]